MILNLKALVLQIHSEEGQLMLPFFTFLVRVDHSNL